MAKVVFEGHACVDCVMAIANGDTSGIEDLEAWEKRVDSVALWKLGNVVVNCPEDCEGEFRTDDCDYCGDHLHGDRHPIAVLN